MRVAPPDGCSRWVLPMGSPAATAKGLSEPSAVSLAPAVSLCLSIAILLP